MAAQKKATKKKATRKKVATKKKAAKKTVKEKTAKKTWKALLEAIPYEGAIRQEDTLLFPANQNESNKTICKICICICIFCN